MTDTITPGPDAATIEVVRRAALRVAENKRAEDAEGVAQDVAVRFVLAMQGGQTLDAPAAWAAHVARNICIDEHRRRQFVHVDVDDADDSEVLPWHVGPSAPVIAQHQVRSALRPLSDRDRRLVLGDAHGESNAELAAQLGFASAAAATKRLHEVRRMLKRRYGWDVEPQRPLLTYREQHFLVLKGMSWRNSPSVATTTASLCSRKGTCVRESHFSSWHCPSTSSPLICRGRTPANPSRATAA